MKCPSCGSARVYPSRLRVFDRLRASMTGRRPLRCHQCGRRCWRVLQVHQPSEDVRPDDLRTGRVSTPVSTTDLDQLDPLTPRT